MPRSRAAARERVEHLPLVAQIERGCRLVEQQDLRFLREHHREPGAPPLAAREPLDRAVRSVGESHR